MTDAPRWYQRLYWRIWLTVFLVVLLVASVTAALWRVDLDRERADRPGRELAVRDAQGVVIGEARLHRWSRSDEDSDDEHDRHEHKAARSGPIFDLALDDGTRYQIELPRPRAGRSHDGVPGGRTVSRWLAQPTGWLLLLLALTALVILAAYPVARRLTRRLEGLQAGVQAWGEGDLSARLPVTGNDEVAFLAKRFNAAAQRVEALIQARQSLLANASHELRSPLARIKMSLALLPEAVSDGEAGVQREISQSIAELDVLIGEILLASRLDHGDQALGEREAVDLTALVRHECRLLDIPVNLAENVVVSGHPPLLQRLVRNLLENAQRHGQSSGATALCDVQVSLCSEEQNAVHPHRRVAVLLVGDNGPGVPPALRERIFEPFFRLPGASERDGGVGLGLALVKTIAEQHGAAVRCIPPPTGQGAWFEVRWS